MQIAQIVPKVRTQKEAVFDYAIPPALLPMVRPGVLVEIPFHGRRLEGIIVSLKSKSPISNLKYLLDIIDPMPVIDDVHLKLAQWMSDCYLTPLGKTLFENIVPPAKRTIEKFPSHDSASSTFFAGAQKVENKKEKKTPTNPGRYLIIGNFQTRLKYYLAAIKRTRLQNKAVIILIPDLSLLPYFTYYLKNSVALLHAKLTKTERWLEWDKIRQQKAKIIIGSNSALFAPVKNLGLIIIDQEENETYKNDRSPRFHTVSVARKLSEISGVNLILGSLIPRIETYYAAVNGKYRILKKHPTSSKNITIVDMNSEKYVISNSLENEIENTLQAKQRVLLVLNRKGEGTKFSCPDCGWIARCEKCGLPLVPQKACLPASRAENVCYRCEKSYLVPEACPQCRNIHLKPLGLGTARLKKFLTDLLPQAKIVQIQKDFDGTSIQNPWDVAITTSYGLKFNWQKIGLVGIIDADQGLNFPDFSSGEKTFQTLYKFLRIGVKGIIQTHLPEDAMISALARLDYEKFFLEEIVQRRKFDFPPFAHLIRLLYKNSDEEKCQKETKKIYNMLASHIFHTSPHITISKPHPAFIEKERGKYRYQIIIKSSKPIPHSSPASPAGRSLISILRSLPKGWIVDRDPVNLL